MNNILILEIGLGSHITQAVEESLALAKQHTDKVVSFDFNGIQVLITSWDTVESGINRWERLRELFSAVYRESPAYKEELKKQIKQVKLEQERLDFLLSHLYLTEGNEDSLIAWLKEFSLIADDDRLKWDKKALAEQLTSFGYAANTFLNLPEKSYNNKAIFAGYLIGQALDQLERGFPPHPMLSSWCDKYKTL